MKDVQYSITAEGTSATRTDINIRGFSVIVDEPEKLGGTNAGPNPLEYELTSLAGCLNVTGHLVARELGFTIESLTMRLAGTLNPARFMGRGEEERAGFKQVTVDIDVVAGTADEATLERWRAAVEDRCPVSDNVSNGTNLTVRIKQ